MKETNHDKNSFIRSLDIIFGNAIINVSQGFLERTPAIASSHEHMGYEMHIICKGEGSMQAGDKLITFSEGSLIIVPPSTTHYYVSFCGDEFKDMTVMFMHKRNPSSRKNNKNMYNLIKELMPKTGKQIVLNNTLYSDFANKIYQTSKLDTPFAQLMMKNYMEGIYINLLDTINNAREIEPFALFHDTKEFNTDIYTVRIIERYFRNCSHENETPTIDGLANCIYTSVRSTQRILKEIYGKSFSDLLTEYRLEKALELMKKSELSITDIAMQSGYNQYKTFYMAFTKHYGISPTRYRENLITQ